MRARARQRDRAVLVPISPTMTRNSVVLPVPLRPTSPTRAPSGMRADAPSRQEPAGNADRNIVEDEHGAFIAAAADWQARAVLARRSFHVRSRV